MPEEWFEGVSFTRDSMENLRDLYMSYKYEKDTATYLGLEQDIIEMADSYKAQVKEAQPLKYHVLNKIENVRRRVFSSGSSYVLLPSMDKMNFFQLGIKLYASACYYLVMIFGLAGLVLLFLQKENSIAKNFAILALIHCIALPLILPFTPATLENRYLFTLYPLLTIGMITWVNKMILKFRRARANRS